MGQLPPKLGWPSSSGCPHSLAHIHAHTGSTNQTRQDNSGNTGHENVRESWRGLGRVETEEVGANTIKMQYLKKLRKRKKILSDRAMTNHGNKSQKHLLTQCFLKPSKEFPQLYAKNETVRKAPGILFMLYTKMWAYQTKRCVVCECMCVCACVQV